MLLGGLVCLVDQVYYIIADMFKLNFFSTNK